MSSTRLHRWKGSGLGLAAALCLYVVLTGYGDRVPSPAAAAPPASSSEGIVERPAPAPSTRVAPSSPIRRSPGGFSRGGIYSPSGPPSSLGPIGTRGIGSGSGSGSGNGAGSGTGTAAPRKSFDGTCRPRSATEAGSIAKGELTRSKGFEGTDLAAAVRHAARALQAASAFPQDSDCAALADAARGRLTDLEKQGLSIREISRGSPLSQKTIIESP